MKIQAKAKEPQAANGRSWYRIKAKAAEGDTPASIEVMIYDEIGYWGITAAQFIKDFNAIDNGGAVTLAINSPGGDVFDGVALNSWAQRLGDRLTARIDGLAASAASVIAVGAHQVTIGQSAMMMIHNPWTFAYGDAGELRKTADMMDKVRDSLLLAYQRKAPAIENAALVKMLDEETWLTAEEAVALGLADVIADKIDARACLHSSNGLLARFRHTPKALLAEAQDPPPDEKPEPQSTAPQATAPQPPDAQALAQSAARLAQACLAAGIPQITGDLLMTAKLTDDKAVTAEAAHIKAIGALCRTAKLPELAADYVKAGLSEEDVRKRLWNKVVDKAGTEIDNKEPAAPDAKATGKAKALDHKAIYAARKKRA